MIYIQILWGFVTLFLKQNVTFSAEIVLDRAKVVYPTPFLCRTKNLLFMI